MSNVGLEIGKGDHAVGVRFHLVQYCFIARMDFHVGSGLTAFQYLFSEQAIFILFVQNRRLGRLSVNAFHHCHSENFADARLLHEGHDP